MTGPPRFGHAEIPVSDPLRAREFYVGVLGFRHGQTQGDRYVWLSLEGASLLLNPDHAPAGRPFREAPNLVLYAADLPAAVEELRGRGLVLEGGPPCWRFRDPDGNWWQIVDPGADHSGA